MAAAAILFPQACSTATTTTTAATASNANYIDRPPTPTTPTTPTIPTTTTTITATPTPPAIDCNSQGLLLAGKGDYLLGIVFRNALVNQWAQWLRLPLVGAAAVGDVVCVKELLAAGADGSSAGQRGPDGSTLVR